MAFWPVRDNGRAVVVLGPVRLDHVAGAVSRVAIGPLRAGVKYWRLVFGMFTVNSGDGFVDMQACVADWAGDGDPTAADVDGGRQLFSAAGGVIEQKAGRSNVNSMVFMPVDISPEDAGRYVLVEIDTQDALGILHGWVALDSH